MKYHSSDDIYSSDDNQESYTTSNDNSGYEFSYDESDDNNRYESNDDEDISSNGYESPDMMHYPRTGLEARRCKNGGFTTSAIIAATTTTYSGNQGVYVSSDKKEGSPTTRIKERTCHLMNHRYH